MDIVQQPTLDVLVQKPAPGLSSVNDVPLIETKPDATPAPVQEKPKDTAVPPSDEGEGEQSEESATSATDEQSGPPKGEGVPKGVGKRLAELTKRLEDERAERLRILSLLEKQQGQPAEPQPEQAAEEDSDPEPARPSKDAYANPDDYEQALDAYYEQKVAWATRKEIAAARAADAAEQQRQLVEQKEREIQQNYSNRVKEAQSKYPDWEAVAERSDVQVTPLMVAAIKLHPAGADIQYFLGQNPQEAQRIGLLTPPEQLLELGMIAAKANAAPVAAAPSPAPKPKPLSVTKAPEPIKPLHSGNAPVSKSPEDMSMEEYARMWNDKEKARRARH